MRQKLLIPGLIALITCAMTLPCSAAQKKKDALAEKWANDKNLVHLLDMPDFTMYVYQGTIKKISPEILAPQYFKSLEAAPPERVYAFWSSTLLKSHIRGTLPGTLKNAVSYTSKWEINCGKNTYQVRKIIYYAANDKVVENIDGTQPPEEAVPDTPGETILGVICELNIQ